MRTKFAAFVAVVGFILGTASVIAHHSFAAEFDGAKPIRLVGTNHPFAITPDRRTLIGTNAAHVSDEIWILNP